MGIGYPLDIVLCSAMGADMFDSVYPTRTARFGAALVGSGTLKLRNRIYAEDFRCAYLLVLGQMVAVTASNAQVRTRYK